MQDTLYSKISILFRYNGKTIKNSVTAINFRNICSVLFFNFVLNYIINLWEQA